uniref:Uncharacterized protein n=1 Tax=Caenorhabditis japonica TaxID=281687 RepID=A0A8R1I585_CAEJA
MSESTKRPSTTTADEIVENEYVNVGRTRSATTTSTASRKEYETLDEFLKRNEYSADSKRDKFKSTQVHSIDSSYKMRKTDLSLQE